MDNTKLYLSLVLGDEGSESIYKDLAYSTQIIRQGKADEKALASLGVHALAKYEDSMDSPVDPD